MLPTVPQVQKEIKGILEFRVYKEQRALQEQWVQKETKGIQGQQDQLQLVRG
jgi:hypothetical protein